MSESKSVERRLAVQKRAASGGALRELVAKWRKCVEDHSKMGEAGEHLAVGEAECADELEAALASPAEPKAALPDG